MSKCMKAKDIKNAFIELVSSGEWLERKTTMNIIKALNNLPTIEVSEDCISREYLLGKVYDMDNDNLVVDLKDIESAPSVVPQTENIKVTCDMVGSKNVIEYQLPKCEKCINYGVEFTEDDSIDTCLVEECHYEPKDEPQGVTTEQSSKVGEWIGTEYDGYADGNPVYYEWICSECKCVVEDEEPMWNYCPNCGAKMKG